MKPIQLPMEIYGHDPEMFHLFSHIDNKYQRTTIIEGKKEGIRIAKADNCIFFKNLTLNQGIHIQNEHVKGFALLVLEAYVLFAKEFEGKEVKIDIRVEEIKEK